jgi:hypothetical protein
MKNPVNFEGNLSFILKIISIIFIKFHHI